MSKLLASRLKFLRTINGYTQQRIADALDMTRSNYSSLERGRTEPDMQMIRRISSFYNISSDFLLGVDIAPVDPQLDEIRAELWEYIATMDRDTAQTILSLFKKLDKQ